MWSYVSGAEKKPANTKIDNYKILLSKWEVWNAKIITWFNDSVEQSIRQLAKFSTAKEIWDYLAKLYLQSNFAKRCQLEHDIRSTVQGIKVYKNFIQLIRKYV